MTELVTVVIPAYNAEATIDETLISVRAQTHTALEIIVVDDGSTDDTAAVVRRHAAADSRVKLLTQPNAGVAAARNLGWRRAASELVAFVDADDLFAPTKIAKQVAAIRTAGDKVGLAYVYFARIDAASMITEQRSPFPNHDASPGIRCPGEGDVLDELMVFNFIGNGSSALVRRDALIRANGFESALHAAGAQGCEDLLFYCRIAESFHFARVPEFLLGYRELPTSMSSNAPRMLRSYLMVGTEMSRRRPDKRPILQRGVRFYALWLIKRAVYGRQFTRVPAILSVLIRNQPGVAASVIFLGLPNLTIEIARGMLRKLKRKLREEGMPEVRMPARFPIGTVRSVREISPT
jgi:glycosyltransferase involved in cell wall biosynthesis